MDQWNRTEPSIRLHASLYIWHDKHDITDERKKGLLGTSYQKKKAYLYIKNKIKLDLYLTPINKPISGRLKTKMWKVKLFIYPEKSVIWKDTCTPMFIAVLFTIAKTWKKPKCPSRDEWIKKMWYIHTVGYYSAVKRTKHCHLQQQECN